MRIATLNAVGLVVMFFLIRIPNLRLLPFELSYLYTNNIARALGIVLILINVLHNKGEARISRTVYSLFIFYFLTQSFSIFVAQNMDAYLLMYKDIVFGILFYFLASLLARTNTKRGYFLPAVIVITGIHIALQLILYFNFSFGEFIKMLLHYKYLDFFNYQFQRGRYFGDSFDEAFIPILIYVLFLPNKKYLALKIISFAILLGITYITFISSWRTKFIIYIIATISTCIFHIKYIHKPQLSLKILFFIGLSVVLLYTIANTGGVNQNIVSRIFEEDVLNSEITTTRLTLLEHAKEIGESSPFFGVGLGNYYDNLPSIIKNNNKSPSPYLHSRFILIDDPHNVFMSTFASTGAIGLCGLLLLLIYFARTDILFFIKNKKITFPAMLILTFWSLFIYSIFNPWIYFSYLSNLWFVRGLADGFIHEKN